MTAAEGLERAANLIQAGGLYQGREETHGECIVTALNRTVLGWENLYEDAWYAAIRAVAQEIDPEFQDAHGCLSATGIIIGWNDTPGRTKDEVVSTMRNSKRWL